VGARLNFLRFSCHFAQHEKFCQPIIALLKRLGVSEPIFCTFKLLFVTVKDGRDGTTCDGFSFLQASCDLFYCILKVRQTPVTDSAFIRLTARGVLQRSACPQGYACRQYGHGRRRGRPHALARGWFLVVPCCLRRCPQLFVRSSCPNSIL
jgi:hypothetical protein